MRRRGVAVPTSCRLWINHWEGDPSNSSSYTIPRTRRRSAKGGAGRIKLTIPGSWAACCSLSPPPPLLLLLFHLQRPRQARVFLASSAPLSADAYSSTQPVCIYTDMFVCCWFPNSQSAPLVSALLFFTLSFFFSSCGRSPSPCLRGACLPPQNLPGSSPHSQSHNHFTESQYSGRPPEESSRGKKNRFLARFLLLSPFGFMDSHLL